LGLPIMSWGDAVLRLDDFDVFVTANELSVPDIIGTLLALGISEDRILNYEPVEKRMGCGFAETFLDIATYGDGLELYCCIQSETGTKTFCDELPKIRVAHNKFDDSSLADFLCFRNQIADNIKTGIFSNKCQNCNAIANKYYFSNRKIRSITLGGDGPCNFSCMDCGHLHNARYQHESPFSEIKSTIPVIERVVGCGLDTRIVLTAGEFSVSDEGNELLELLNNYHVALYSNAYRWSDATARSLGAGKAYLYTSVDAGTRETFYRIKGVDAFDTVCGNLREYSKCGIVVLKYIVFEGINDNYKDINGFFELADAIATRVVIARNIYHGNTFYSESTLQKIVYFIKHFRNNKKMGSLVGFVREHRQIDRILEEHENE